MQKSISWHNLRMKGKTDKDLRNRLINSASEIEILEVLSCHIRDQRRY